VRVGVVEAFFEDHLQEGVDGGIGDFVGVYARLFEGGAVGNLDAADALHGDDFIGAKLGEDLGDMDIARAPEHEGEALGVAGLQAVVQLALHGLGKLADEGFQVVALGPVPGALGTAGDGLENLQVELDLFHDVGPPHLHDDFRAIVQGSGMDLADGGSCEGTIIEGGEELGGRLAEGSFDHSPNLGGGHRRGGVLELGELGLVGRSNQVGTGGENLAELDEGGSQLLESFPDLLGFGIGQGRAAAPEEAGGRESIGDHVQQMHEAASGEDGGDLPIAAKVGTFCGRRRGCRLI